MYAIIKSGGKQYRVAEGNTLKIEKLTVAAGNHFDFNEVLMVANGEDIRIGSPFLANVKVTAEVIGDGRGDKITIVKFRRRKHYLKRAGHRQDFTEVKIISIKPG